jgi:hypothetical protein
MTSSAAIKPFINIRQERRQYKTGVKIKPIPDPGKDEFAESYSMPYNKYSALVSRP